MNFIAKHTRIAHTNIAHTNMHVNLRLTRAPVRARASLSLSLSLTHTVLDIQVQILQPRAYSVVRRQSVEIEVSISGMQVPAKS